MTFQHNSILIKHSDEEKQHRVLGVIIFLQSRHVAVSVDKNFLQCEQEP